MKLYLWDDVIGFAGDRSTGNRLFNWDIIQYLNSKNDFGFEIKLLESDHQWLKSGLVNLANSSTYRKYEMPSDVFNLNPLLTFEELLPYFHEGKKLPLKDNLISLAGFGPFKLFHTGVMGKTIDIHGGQLYNHPFVKDVEFNKELFQKTGEVAKDIFVTIHVRRGSGCRHPQKYIDEIMSEKTKKYFVDKKDLKISLQDGELHHIVPAKKMVIDAAEKGSPLECHQVYQSPLHTFYEDDVYFELFDKILALDPDAKICLVHDTFDEDYNHWFEKYPKNLVTSRQLLNKEDFSDPILKNEVDEILRLFIDLLIFLQTRFCVRPNSSTFSGFAVNWKNFKGGARWNDPDLKKDPRRNRWDGSNYKKYQTLDMETFQDNRIVTEILIDEVMEK